MVAMLVGELSKRRMRQFSAARNRFGPYNTKTRLSACWFGALSVTVQINTNGAIIDLIRAQCIVGGAQTSLPAVFLLSFLSVPEGLALVRWMWSLCISDQDAVLLKGQKSALTWMSRSLYEDEQLTDTEELGDWEWEPYGMCWLHLKTAAHYTITWLETPIKSKELSEIGNN